MSDSESDRPTADVPVTADAADAGSASDAAFGDGVAAGCAPRR